MKRGVKMDNYEKQKQEFHDLYDDEKISLLNEYLESVNCSDNAIYPMEELDDMLSGNRPEEIIRLALYGTRFGFGEDNFNLNDDYFSFNGYGNLISLASYCIEEYCDLYLDDMIQAGALEHLIDDDDDEEGGE
jgi:hypothetical protein